MLFRGADYLYLYKYKKHLLQHMSPRKIMIKSKSKNNQVTAEEKALNKFSVSLIKGVGIVGAIIGLLIIIAFWYWVFMKLYKV